MRRSFSVRRVDARANIVQPAEYDDRYTRASRLPRGDEMIPVRRYVVPTSRANDREKRVATKDGELRGRDERRRNHAAARTHVEELLPVRRPDGPIRATHGDLKSSSGSRKGLHVHLSNPRVVCEIRQPPSVW